MVLNITCTEEIRGKYFPVALPQNNYINVFGTFPGSITNTQLNKPERLQ